jgi:hypothetical protein
MNRTPCRRDTCVNIASNQLRRWIPIRPKHADKAFGMAFGNLGELSEPTLRINKPPR